VELTAFPRTANWEALQWIGGIKCEQDWARAFALAVMKARVL
jgi:hypothetical protein